MTTKTRKSVSDKRLSNTIEQYEAIAAEIKPYLDQMDALKEVIVEGVKERGETVEGEDYKFVFSDQSEYADYPKAELEKVWKRSEVLKRIRRMKTRKASVRFTRKAK